MERRTILNMNEVIDFMQRYAKIGDRFGSSAIQRRFRTGYMNARLALHETGVIRYLKFISNGAVYWTRIK
ncbi:hypothetical protein [Bacillus sp. SM2101]|uniref:hypothetical protein n=1 Tax=Bacillus sp. SM2101 TaxID=2805366 RepID=UPI001BDE4671|nr:hypothetical protein [Bacillus sp. SM2101]